MTVCTTCAGTHVIGDGVYAVKCGACLEEGAKHDKGKPRLDLIPPEAVIALGEVFHYGAEKYVARNWEKGIDWGRLFAAQQRHMWAWWAGEENDPESGLPHLAHALCCMAMLIAEVERNIGADTRRLSRTSE